VCLTPDGIRRSETIVQEIHFTSGLDLTVAETIALQEAGAVVLPRHQLIRPRNASPYYRAPADDSVDNNVESLPVF
jgi:hypothetical protein